MSRNAKIQVPRATEDMLKLSQDLLDKHLKDGADSPLDADMITEMLAARTLAAEHQTNYDGYRKRRSTLAESLAIKLGKMPGQSTYSDQSVLFYIASARDVLLGKYRQDPRTLELWGFKVSTKSGKTAVVIPSDPEEIIKLAGDIVKKHEDDNANSLLRFLNMEKMKSLFDASTPIVSELDQIRKEMEALTEARRRALGLLKTQNSKTYGTVYYYLCSFRDTLLGIYRGQEKQLGDWGFEVNEVRRGRKKESGDQAPA